MTEQFSLGSSDPSYLARTFESLRKGAGMKSLRKRVGLKPPKVADDLLRLPIVQQRLALNGDDDPGEAAVQVVRENAQLLAKATARIIADAVLGLEMYIEDYRKQRIPEREIRILQGGTLGKRREVLRARWADLHAALSASADDPPSDRSLRGFMERDVFEELAGLLVRRPTATARTTHPIVYSSSAPDDARSARPADKVVVVGGVTIDHIWQVERLPELETSTMATQYTRSPGGKGLSQAVAVARLGLDVALLAAVGDDDDGRQIVAYLESEGVDTSLMKIVRGSTTPATGIFERPLGESAAVFWRNALELDIEHVDRHAKTLSDCGAVLLTFEVPQRILYRTLNLATGVPDRCPVIVVTPGQPYAHGALSSEALRQIDYLVARPWELEGFARSPHARYDPGLLSQELLGQGLRSLCILGNRGGTIYLPTGDTISIPATSSVIKESSITRDAFCAALAAHLVVDHSLTHDAVEWAAAAMSAVAEDYRLSPSPPRRDRVEAQYREHFKRA